MSMSPEGRAALAEARRRDWADPVKRELKLMRLREASQERARQACERRGEEWIPPEEIDPMPDDPIILRIGTVALSSVPRRDCMELDMTQASLFPEYVPDQIYRGAAGSSARTGIAS